MDPPNSKVSPALATVCLTSEVPTHCVYHVTIFPRSVITGKCKKHAYKG